MAHSATHWATEDTLMTLLEAISDLCRGEHVIGVSETGLSKSMPVIRGDLMPLLAQACRAVARQDHTKAWEHLEVNDEDESDWLAAEASGLADRGELYTDKFPEKQACVEKIEVDEPATGGALYDEEEEAMLRQEEGRAEGPSRTDKKTHFSRKAKIRK